MENEAHQFSAAVRELLTKYQESLIVSRAPEEEESTIQVDDVASRVAAFYERLRMIIDWKDEHLIRRTAIERSLKRRLLSELGFGFASNSKVGALAESLVLELIRGGHFPNAAIPQVKLSAVEKVLEKYIYILEKAPINGEPSPTGAKKKINFYNWILEIAACEIEEVLAPATKENALIDFMTMQLGERLRVDPSLGLGEDEKHLQTHIAVHRTLFRLDSPIISYHLFKYRYPDWSDLSEERLKEIAAGIFSIWEELEKTLNHPLYNQFYKFCERYNALYLLMGDILNLFESRPDGIEAALANPNIFKSLVERVYGERLATLKSRLSRIAFYSTLSIFVASGFSLFLVEVPLARLFADGFSPLALAIDMLVPTVWMFFLVRSIRLPDRENLERVLTGMKRIVYEDSSVGFFEIRPAKKRGWGMVFIITLFYFLGWCVSLSSVAAAFYYTRVPLPSVVLDTINIAIVTFVGLQIRQRANEVRVGEEKTRFGDFVFDTLSLPVARFGQWLSSKWKEYNIVAVFFAALIDMPFQALIEFVESWSAFLKEKKSGMYS